MSAFHATSIGQKHPKNTLDTPVIYSRIKLKYNELLRKQCFFWCISSSYFVSLNLFSKLFLKHSVSRPGKSCKRCKRHLRTFCRKSRYFEDIYPVLMSEDGGGRVSDGELRFYCGDLSWRMENGAFWIQNRG